MNGDDVVGVVGLGTVGSALRRRLQGVGVSVVGVDPDPNTKPDYADLAAVPPSCAALILCVPTPVAEPLRVLLDVVGHVNHLSAWIPQTVIVESTLPPGGALLLRRELRHECGLAYCPERHIPFGGEQNWVRLVSGFEPGSVQAAKRIYTVAGWTTTEGSPGEVELAKLLENAQRAVLIGWAAEFAALAKGLGVDPWEVYRLANTKRVGYLPMSHSAGVGGHCVSTGPQWLPLRGGSVLSAALGWLWEMPKFAAWAICAAGVRNHRLARQVVLVGCGYKPGAVGGPNPPALQLQRELEGRVTVILYDPLIEEYQLSQSVLSAALAGSDVVAIVQPQGVELLNFIVQNARRVVDCCGCIPQPLPANVERL